MEIAWTAIIDWLAQYGAVFQWIAWAIVAVGIIQNLVYASHIPMAWRELKEHTQYRDTQAAWDMLTSKAYLPISIIVPAYNEGVTIVESINSLLTLRYPDFELIVVNDGSKDDTMEQLKAHFGLVETTRARDELSIDHSPIKTVYASPIYPNIIVIDKINGGGKADAMNAGLACVRTPLFCVMDADSILEPTALINAVRPFVESPERVVAVGGTVGIANGCTIRNGEMKAFGLPRKFIPRVQVVEYTRAFLMARLAMSKSQTLTLISGAFGIFRRDIAVEVGGFDRTTLGEDMEMVLRLHHHLKAKGEDYEMRYVPEPVCWTEAPENLEFLSKQRIRWQRGALECLSRHRGMIFNPRYGRLGMISMPLMVIVDIIGPIVEALGYLLIPFFALTGILSIQFFFAYMALVFLFGVFLSTTSILLEQAELERFASPRDLLILTLTAILENFGYRQLCNWWRIKGLYRHFTGKKAVWEPMQRVGFGK